jgi:micrococcal nuclease
MKPGKDPIIVLVFIILALGFYFFSAREERQGEEKWVRVEEVIDGDTIIIDDGRDSQVRYLGIDTPEIAIQGSPGDPLAEEAKIFNERLVEGKRVRLELDQDKYDRYGRLLAHVFVGGIHVNKEMLRNGYGLPLVIEPNKKYSELMYSAAEEAKSQRKGVWRDLTELRHPSGNNEFLIDVTKADRYEGKRVVARGVINDAVEKEKVTVLSIEEGLNIVIFSDDMNNFEFFGIEPAHYYKGKNVEVTGRVRMYKGEPEIIVDHPMLIRTIE